ncbi:MAG: DUF6563 family protein [Bacteroidota bacterium]
MKPSIFSILLTLIPLLICGQNIPATYENYYIKPKPKNDDFSERKMYVSKVIDNRKEKEHLGGVLVGNTIYRAQFKQPFEKTIQAIFLKLFPFQESMLATTVVVNRFLIEEYDGLGITTVDLQFFANNADSSFFSIQKSLEIRGKDVTNKHRKVIVDLLSDCFREANFKATKLLSTKQIQQEASLKLTLPLERGIYNNFYEMVTNEPLPNVPITIVKRDKDKMERYDLKYLERDRKRIKKAFAASDGKDLYLNFRSIYYNFKKYNNEKNYQSPLTNNYYLKAKPYGRYLYFEDKVTSSGASFAFGMLGALAAIRKVGFVLDTEDGTIQLLDTDFLREITKGKQDIKDIYNDSEKKLEDKEAVLKALYKSSIDQDK